MVRNFELKKRRSCSVVHSPNNVVAINNGMKYCVITKNETRYLRTNADVNIRVGVKNSDTLITNNVGMFSINELNHMMMIDGNGFTRRANGFRKIKYLQYYEMKMIDDHIPVDSYQCHRKCRDEV
ncbi:hypothetical protein BLOT_016011 [Blomia tropicalis]|nr:hypothetical protein BLOT_016011 [Blomia tropicalis]